MALDQLDYVWPHFIERAFLKCRSSLQLTIIYNVNKLSSDMNARKRKELLNMDIILKSILRRQIPFLIGGTITGTIMTYYYGFPFTIVVNSAIWYGISLIVNKYYWKNKGLADQKYLIQYALSKISSSKRKST
jgi:ABC-type transport system involved in Fe-S cluster assembly fused permease/ATPase subunit